MSDPVFSLNLSELQGPPLIFQQIKTVFLVTLVIFLAGVAIIPFIGREYIPYLEEGTLHLRATMDPNISLKEVIAIASKLEKTIKEVLRILVI